MGIDNLEPATRARLRLLYPDIAIRAARLFQDIYLHSGQKRMLKVTEGVRTFARQEELYAQGRTAPGKIVTNAKPGLSLHHYGVALDCAFVGQDPYLAKVAVGERRAIWTNFGKLARIHGFTWGGDWDGDGDENDQTLHDTPHLELTYGLSLTEIRKLYEHKGLTAVWAKFDEIRGVEQASEWTGPLTKYRLLELGDLPL